jgi:hypothetical protein
MDGWMSGWVGGWVDGLMDGWMDGWMDGRTDGRTDGWMVGGQAYYRGFLSLRKIWDIVMKVVWHTEQWKDVNR